jgi:hypothetical protein
MILKIMLGNSQKENWNMLFEKRKMLWCTCPTQWKMLRALNRFVFNETRYKFLSVTEYGWMEHCVRDFHLQGLYKFWHATYKFCRTRWVFACISLVFRHMTLASFRSNFCSLFYFKNKFRIHLMTHTILQMSACVCNYIVRVETSTRWIRYHMHSRLYFLRKKISFC